MSDIDKNKVKIIYTELQSYLRTMPTELRIYNAPMWDIYHTTIDELNTITGSDYSKFKVIVSNNSWEEMVEDDSINRDEYIQKLNALISRLHIEYFSDEQPPFTNSNHKSYLAN